MIRRAFMAAALVAVCASFPAAAQERSSPRSDYGNKKICKLEGRAGSRLGGKRTCRTQAEWDQQARESRLLAERIQRGTAACMVGSNDPKSPIHLRCSDFGP
jgi:hypothetical protein